jgi:hypothetical protein
VSPTPIEWADEHKRLENIRVHRGCPHGRLDSCRTCEELELMAQREILATRGVWEDDGWSPGEGGEFDDEPDHTDLIR